MTLDEFMRLNDAVKQRMITRHTLGVGGCVVGPNKFVGLPSFLYELRDSLMGRYPDSLMNFFDSEVLAAKEKRKSFRFWRNNQDEPAIELLCRYHEIREKEEERKKNFGILQTELERIYDLLEEENIKNEDKKKN